MARSMLAAATASLCLLAGGAAVLSDAGSALGAHASSYGSPPAPCKSARSSNYGNSKCRHGRRHSGPGGSGDILFFTARNGHCPYATLRPTKHDIARVRAATLCLVNRERSRRGERLLHWNVHLVASAQKHTESMAYGDYFEHVGPNGLTPAMRMRHTGYISSARVGYEVAENIGWGSLWLGTPKAMVASWMHSAGHRANILDPHFRDTGIGISPHTNGLAHGQRGGVYTQDFGVIVG
jgi:uncharacterized protein YkwD